MVVFLPSAYREDCAWLPKNWIEFKSEDDPEALRELIAILRPSLKVFLCHSKTDKPAVRELHTLLASDGFRPWLDEKDLIAGQEWQLTIQEEVQSSQIVIVCLSPAAVNKAGFVQKEIRLALDVADLQPEGSIFLIPTRLEDCDVPIRLRKWQWVDLWTPAGSDAVGCPELAAERIGYYRGQRVNSSRSSTAHYLAAIAAGKNHPDCCSQSRLGSFY